MNEKYQAVKVSRSLQMTLSVIAVCQLIVQFSIDKQYSKRTCQIETSFREENWLIFAEFRGKDAWEAAGFPATAQVNTGNQPLARLPPKSLALVKSSPYLQSVYSVLNFSRIQNVTSVSIHVTINRERISWVSGVNPVSTISSASPLVEMSLQDEPGIEAFEPFFSYNKTVKDNLTLTVKP